MISRRARIILGLLIVASLTLVILDLRGGRGPFATVRTAVASVIGFGQLGAARAASPFVGAVEWWGTWTDQRERISALEAQNAELLDLVNRSEEDRARADALDGVLKVAGVGRYRIIPAEVIAIGPRRDFAWTVTIDAGRSDGIETNMTVINDRGLVGRVLEATRSTATVVLLTDASASVGVRVAGTEEIGILSGTGRQDSLDLQLLDPLAPLDVGDVLVSFGSKSGRPYAPGIPIGTVVDVSGTAGQLARVATVRPFVNVSALTIVGVVVRPPRTDPRDSVLPAIPELGGATLAPTQPAEGTDAGSGPVDGEAPNLEQPATPAPSANPNAQPNVGSAGSTSGGVSQDGEPSGEPTRNQNP